MRELTENEVLDLLTEGYCEEDIKNGYGEYYCYGSEVIIDGALVIEKINMVNKFDDDFEASRQAEKDGVIFINDIEGLEKGCYIDTPENRKLCVDKLKEFPAYRVENLMLNHPDGDYWEAYSEYCKVA